jgi:cell wall-associated NlpC family hydrolase
MATGCHRKENTGMLESKRAVHGTDIVKLAMTKEGQRYVLGAFVDFDEEDWDGPWDCAEFVSWVVYKLTGKKYGFTRNEDGDLVEPWTGAWLTDMVVGRVTQIPVSEAKRTPGAILLRRTEKSGHIGFYAGNGWTIEARGHAYGVCKAPADGRGWTAGILIPDVLYEEE